MAWKADFIIRWIIKFFDQDQERVITGNIGELTARENEILLVGCLFNYNRKQLKK